MASLPRPSRPSTNNNPPPTSPLPSVPAASSTRQSGIPSQERPVSSASTPSSAIPQRFTKRTGSSSSVNSLASGQSNIPAAPQPASTTTPQPSKPLRKTISYNSFPRPPAGSRTPSVASNPSSNSTTPRSSLPATNGVPMAAGRTMSLRSTSTPTSAAVPASTTSAIDGIVVAEEEQEHDDDANEDSPRGRQRPTSSSTTKDKGNVVISVRVRPEKESNDGDAGHREWTIEGKQSLVSYGGKEGGEYYYDNVFTTRDKNARVYDQAAKRLVRRVMEGYNGTVFAYGMTGTGKTFSMQGTATSPGVIPLAITDIFSFIRETPQREFLLRVSYLEIYNEKIFDLLATPAGATPGVQQEDIKLREDNKGNVYAAPLKEEIVQSPTQLLRVISRGDQSRRTYSTQFNARSSRSHAVVQIVVESRERNAGASTGKGENKRAPIIPGGVRVSTLSLIDLAGSERAAESKERRTEGAHINKSLLTLGTVISKLSGKRDKQGQPTDKDGKHLPYRDSKLTRLLQPALSGNSLISILCTIQLGAAGSSAVAGHHTIETLNTLKFAARARNNIVSHAKKAEEAHGNMGDAGSRALLDRYRLEILDLRKQLEEQKGEKGEKGEKEKPNVEPEEKPKEVEADQRHEEQMLEMQLARTALKERIEHLNRLILSSKSIGVNADRSFSSLSLVNPRISNLTENSGYSRSVRSSASTATLDPNRRDPDYRTSAFSAAPTNNGFEEEEEEDTMGENGDGTASLNAQIKSLQADLSDKHRYIQTLEKRLLQARRSSRSRVSMGFANRIAIPSPEEGGIESLLLSKDAEIAELREKLDDKDRMLAALRSAARKRDTADTNLTSSSGVPPGSEEANSSPTSGGAELRPVDRDTSSARRRSTDGYRNSALASWSRPSNERRSSLGPGSLSIASSIANNTPTKILQTGQPSPRSPGGGKKNHGVDEMTRMLDEMIRQKMESESNYDRNAGDSDIRRHSLLSGPNGVLPLAGMPNGGSSKNGYRNVRLSTDSSRLSGWEPNSNRRRRSSLLNHGPPPSDGPNAKPLPNPPSKRRSGGSKDLSHPSGSPRPSSANPMSQIQASPPTSSSSAQTQVPGSYNAYSNSTAAASQAIEALRPNSLARNSPRQASTSLSSNSSLTATGADHGLAEDGPSTDDTSGDDEIVPNSGRAVNGEFDTSSISREQRSLGQAAAVAASSV